MFLAAPEAVRVAADLGGVEKAGAKADRSLAGPLRDAAAGAGSDPATAFQAADDGLFSFIENKPKPAS